MHMKHPPLGSISSGTLQDADLIPTFTDTLLSLSKLNDGDIDLSLVLDALENALNDLSPPFCYFGTHEGDGTDFGFWLDRDALQEAIADGEILKLPAGDPWPTNLGIAAYVLEVNNHGNQTLFDLDHTEVWSIV